jgi:MFS family permease
MSEATTSEKSLEVPGEPGVYWCARHSKVKTRLRCGRCETPICTKCTKFGPTGARCPACVSNKSLHIYQISPVQYAAAIVVSLVLGALSGMIASAGFIGLFVLFYAPAAGTLIGKAISAVTKHKRGTPLAMIAAGGLIAGALLAGSGNLLNPFLWLYLILAIPSVWYWLK